MSQRIFNAEGVVVYPPKTKQDARLKDFAWRLRVGFDNITKAPWKKPVLGLYYSRKGKKK